MKGYLWDVGPLVNGEMKYLTYSEFIAIDTLLGLSTQKGFSVVAIKFRAMENSLSRSEADVVSVIGRWFMTWEREKNIKFLRKHSLSHNMFKLVFGLLEHVLLETTEWDAMSYSEKLRLINTCFFRTSDNKLCVFSFPLFGLRSELNVSNNLFEDKTDDSLFKLVKTHKNKFIKH